MARERAVERRPVRTPGARPRNAEETTPLERDRDVILSAALLALARGVNATRALAVGRGPDGEARVFASRAGADAAARARDALAALEALPEAADLGAPGRAAALAELARSAGVSAAAPVRRGDGRSLAVLVLGGPADPPGRVRPRTLAALASAARRLETPLAAAEALARVAQLDLGVRRLDRLAALGELTAEIAHEVRNPLVSVKTFLQLLPDHLEDREFLSRFFRIVEEEVRRMERLLDAVMEHARPRLESEERTCKAIPVLESVASLLAYRAAERSVVLEVASPASLPSVALSEDALRQVVLNLTQNALAASPAGGRVRVTACRAGGEVEIRVEDQGSGVPAELRERIFEPFFSTREDRPGGLGLAISRRLAEEAGGSLRLRARAGGGSVFSLRLPCGEA